MTPQAAFDQALDFFVNSDNGGTLGVAVSGGSDSMALLLLAQNHARRYGYQVAAATVDHGLRPESATEAMQVARFCANRGIAHQTLKWSGWTGDGNLQAAARQGRYRCLEDWAEDHEIDVVLIGHTHDDQAETVLMNLARGSGVDGLAGMDTWLDGLFFRPLLTVSRAALQDDLRDKGITWFDDPSNQDFRFDRVKVRQMRDHLAGLGLTAERLVQTATHMQRAQTSLRKQAAAFAKQHVDVDGPDLLFDRAALELSNSDSPARVLSAAIQWIGGSDYRPRFRALSDAAEALLSGQRRTLGGVIIGPDGPRFRLSREPKATAGPAVMSGEETALIWDKRWRIAGPITSGLRVQALGDAITALPDWREIGLPRETLTTTPAIFDGDSMLAAPAAGLKNGWTAQIVADFASCLASH